MLYMISFYVIFYALSLGAAIMATALPPAAVTSLASGTSLHSLTP